jgi:leader peptidase (prepilin peptidase)/N-methyltransferase
VLYTLLLLNKGFTKEFLFLFPLVGILIALTFIDIEFRILPNKIVLISVLLGLSLSPLIGIGLRGSFFGFLVGGGTLLSIYLISRGGMGEGDIKMMAMVGIYLGLPLTLLALFIAFFIGGILGAFLLITKKASRKTPIPFGPILALSTYISVIKGYEIFSWYFGGVYPW